MIATETLLSLPPLENGDRLSRTEFERRYSAMPHLKKAELIEGVVYQENQKVTFDLTEYAIPPIDRVLGLLVHAASS